MIMFIITYKNFLQVFNFLTAVIFDHFKFMSLTVGLTTTRTTCASTERPAFSSSSARNVNFFCFFPFDGPVVFPKYGKYFVAYLFVHALSVIWFSKDGYF